MSRKNAREDTFKLIFEAMINKGDYNDKLKNYFEAVAEPISEEESAFVNTPTHVDNQYIEAVLKGVNENIEKLDKIIKENLKGWEIDRVSKTSIAAIRLALYEMMFLDDVPTSVAINEAVEIAKKYDGPEAGAFVNGVLGSATNKEG